MDLDRDRRALRRHGQIFISEKEHNMDNMVDEAHKETRNTNGPFLKRVAGSISRWLKKPMIEINLDVSTPAPAMQKQPEPAEQKPEPEQPAKEPKPTELESGQEHAEQDAKPAAVEPAAEGKKEEPRVEENQKEEEPKPAPVKAPAPKRRIAFKSAVPPSKISAWVHNLAPTRENQSIQAKIIDAGPACIEHLMRFIDDEKVYMSARQVAMDMVIRVWMAYSEDAELSEDLAEFYLKNVLPSLKGIMDSDLKKNLPSNVISKIEGKANEILSGRKDN